MKLTSIAIIPVLMLVTGCAGQARESAKSAASSPSEFSSQEPPRNARASRDRSVTENVAKLAGNSVTAMPRDVVKTGSMTVQVDSVDKSEKQARDVAESLGGRVDRVTSSDLSSPTASMDMTLRIPVASFEKAMEQLQSLGTRLAKTVEAQDVTDQIFDFNARLKTMRVQEELVRNMLRRSGTLEDSLTINNDLTRLRAEIESLDAKRKSLASQAAYSTLELRLVQKTTALAMSTTDPNWFQSSWAEAWGAGTVVFRSIVSVLMWLVVFSPLWILGAVVVRRGIRVVNSQSGPVSPA